MIPWRYTLTVDLTPDQVFDRLEDVTDQSRLSPWKAFWDMGPSMDGELSRVRFRGTIDRDLRKFYLHGNLTGADRSQTAFTGRVEPNGAGAIVKVWISATKLGLVFLTIFGIGAVTVSAYLLWLVFRNSRPAPVWFLFIPFTFLVIVPLIDVWINKKARRIMREVVEGNHKTQWPDPWPLGRGAGTRSQRSPGKQKDRVPPDAPLIVHFRHAFDPILADPATPSHRLEIDEGNTGLTLTFPPATESGYEVRAVVAGNELTVWVGEWIKVPFESMYPFDAVRHAIGIMRELLSPRCRLREHYVGSELWLAQLDTLDDQKWRERVFDYEQRFVSAGDEMTELEYINHQMPVRHGRHYI